MKHFIRSVLVLALGAILFIALGGSGGVKYQYANYGDLGPTPTPTPVPSSCWAGGTHSNTEVNGSDNLQLSAAQTSGDFTSAIFDNGSSTTWSAFGWTSQLPLWKELPSNLVSEAITDYPSLVSSTLENNLLGLWHLNEPSGFPADATGNGHTGTVVNSVTLGVLGRFQDGIQIPGGGGNYINTTGWTGEFAGAASRTFSVWFNTASNDHDGAMIGYGYLSASSDAFFIEFYPNNIGVETSGPVAVVVNNASYLDGTWHHIAATYENPLLTLYIDGVSVGTDSGVINTDATRDILRLGQYPEPNTGSFKGKLDEMAVWDRALSSAEIVQLYRRGINRAKFQVRSCDDAACSGEAWIGPDGTNLSYFTELNNNSNQEDMDGNVLATTPEMTFSNFPSAIIAANRYWQYKAFLETDNTTYNSVVICTDTTHP